MIFDDWQFLITMASSNTYQTYQALARKYRPQTFDDFAGQETSIQQLKQAILQKKIHHAYLYTGTRGIGKTSLARLFAKCINCEQGITVSPCNTCIRCQQITNGQSIDVIEIDAASRTRVEDTREILDNIQYLPTDAPFKIYIIDEVHMLSNHSFNALLKTLEEPPEYVKFILATTDPQRIPITVLSRCLQFHLQKLHPTTIVEKLQSILLQESIPAEVEALHYIAEAANGSMRDALSLLDQVILHSTANPANQTTTHAITEIQTKIALGIISEHHIEKIATFIVEPNMPEFLKYSDALDAYHLNYMDLLDTLATLWYQVNLFKINPQNDNAPFLKQLSETLSLQQLQNLYKLCLQGKQDLMHAQQTKIAFNMNILRMMLTLFPESAMIPKHTIDTNAQIPQKPNPDPKPDPQTPNHSICPAEMLDDTPPNTAWLQASKHIKLRGPAQQIILNAYAIHLDENQLSLKIPDHLFNLLSDHIRQKLKIEISKAFNRTLKINFHQNTIKAPSPESTENTIVSTPKEIIDDEVTQKKQSALSKLKQNPTVQKISAHYNIELSTEQFTHDE